MTSHKYFCSLIQELLYNHLLKLLLFYCYVATYYTNNRNILYIYVCLYALKYKKKKNLKFCCKFIQT